MKEDSDVARTKLLKRLDRAARIQILGIRGLYQPDHHPRHRPATIDAALKRDEIAQFVGIYRALHPYRDKRESILAAVKLFGCKRAYVYRAWKQLDPERRKYLRAVASVLRLGGLR
jgi:hypothetical protein